MNDLLFAVKGPGGPSNGAGGSGGGPPGRGAPGHDIEAGYSAAQSERSKEMDEFFARVEDVKGDMQEVKGRQRDIRAMHERSKTIVRQKEMQRHREEMQAVINEVNTIAHKVKSKVEALDRLNEQALTRKGQGLGSASERTRTSITAGLKRKLKDLMGEFSELRAKVGRRWGLQRWRGGTGSSSAGGRARSREGGGIRVAYPQS